MTIPNTARKAGPLLGTGSQTAWPFTFKVFAAADVAVSVTDAAGAVTVLTLGTDYTVTLNSNQDTSPGGTINYPVSGAALPVGSAIAIIGDLDYDQALDLPSGGNFSPTALENQLDRATMQIQQLKELSDRSAKMSVFSSPEDVELLTSSIITLAAIDQEIVAVADNEDNINTVADNIGSVNTVAANIANVAAAGANTTNINAVVANASNINAAVANATNINAAVANATNINAAVANAANINAVVANEPAIDTVAANIADVNTVADNVSLMNTVADNLSAWRDVTAGDDIQVTNFNGTGSQTAFTLPFSPGAENNTQVFIGGVYQQKDQYTVSGTTLTFSSAPPSGTANIEVVWSRPFVLGATDAALVGYLPAGTGAVATDVQAFLRSQFESNTASEDVVYGPELMDGTGWALGANWSGSFATGFTHATGAVATLTKSYSFTAGKIYQVAITVNSPSSTKTSNSGWTISINGSVGFEMYEGNFTSHTYYRGIAALSGSDLVITPESTFDGTISAVSVREVISTPQAVTTLTDSSSQTIFEVRPLVRALANVFLGIDNATKNTTGNENVGVGYYALQLNTSGFWNTAIGTLALSQNTVGSRNIGIGYVALQNNISGHRNIGIGTFALKENTHGHNNVAIGADCMSGMQTGFANIALGLGALGVSATGRENIAIGVAALGLLGDSHNHVAIGDYAAAFLVGSAATRATLAIGHDSARQSTAAPNLALGQNALKENVTGDRNIAIGNEALKNVTTSNQNLVIGVDACPGTASSTLTRNLVIGHGAGTAMTTGANYNIILGYASGGSYTTANNNILIGYNVQGQTATETYRMNIGNILYGNLSASRRNIGIDVANPQARLHLPAGEAGAERAPMRFTPGVLQTTPEIGALEFDGTDLYLTNAAGVRRKIQLV